MEPPQNRQKSPRLDKWLWAVRLYKTRTLATEAIRSGHVALDGQPVKPARDVKVGDVYELRQGPLRKTVKVLALLEKRVGPKLAPNYAEDLTPASEYLKVMQARENAPIKRDPGAGRPTKRDRRALEKIFGE
jgi:ribosome-associated heat shock protein Hsp15